MGLSSSYNWNTKKYEDSNGNEVSWNNVKKEYGIDQGGDSNFIESNDIVKIEYGNYKNDGVADVSLFPDVAKNFINKVKEKDVKNELYIIDIVVQLPYNNFGLSKRKLEKAISGLDVDLANAIRLAAYKYDQIPYIDFDKINRAYSYAKETLTKEYPKFYYINVKTEFTKSSCSDASRYPCSLGHGTSKSGYIYYIYRKSTKNANPSKFNKV